MFRKVRSPASSPLSVLHRSLPLYFLFTQVGLVNLKPTNHSYNSSPPLLQLLPRCLAFSLSKTVSTGIHFSPLYLHLLHQGLCGGTNACKWRCFLESAGLKPILYVPAGYILSKVTKAREYMSSRRSSVRSWSSRPWTCCRGMTRRCMNALGRLSLMMKHWSVATRTCLDCSLIAQKEHCGGRGGGRERVSGVRESVGRSLE